MDLQGKPLTEFRAEIELGMTIWVLPEGYCAVCKTAEGDYMYSACTDEWWPSWEEMLTELGEFAQKPIFSTYSPELMRRKQENIDTWLERQE